MRQLILSLLAAGGAYFSQGESPVDVGNVAPKDLSPSACGTASCHTEIVTEWRTSRHARAWTSDIFQHEYTQNRARWCVHCHAPLKQQVAEVIAGAPELAKEGITCAVCHFREGRLSAPRKFVDSPHDTRVDPAFGSPEFCAGCHQFNFAALDEAGRVQRFTHHPMQQTLEQYRARPSQPAGGCYACHGSTTAHAFPAAHSDRMLRSAVMMSVCRPEPTTLLLQLTNVGAGHHVPTGGVNRHLSLRAWRSSSPEHYRDIFIGRRFQLAPGGGKETVWDSTLVPHQPQAHSIELAELGGQPEEPVNVELRFMYVPEGFAPIAFVGEEPTSRVIERRRLRPTAIPPCRHP